MGLSIHVEKMLEDFHLKIDLEIESGIVGLLGYSGSGKTMTLKMIAGIVKPDKGQIILNGKVLFDSEKGVHLKPQQRNVGLMFQSYALFNEMNVYKNITLAMKGTKEENRKQAQKYLELLEIEHLKDKKPAQLSGGQKQRVALARLLVQKPDILLLDEPFSALDNHLKFKIESQFKKALDTFPGIVLYVSHNRQEIYRYCTQTAVIFDGQVEEFMETQRLFEACTTQAGAKLTGCRNIAKCHWISEREVEVEGWGLRLYAPFREEVFDYIGLRESYFSLKKEVLEPFTIPVSLKQRIKMPDKIKLELWTLEKEKIIVTCSLKQYEAIEEILESQHFGLKISPDKLLYLKK